jgi:hypothetical protein
MATELARQILNEIQAARNPVIRELHKLDTRVPWPGKSRNVWPQADISGTLTTEEYFIIEIDDHADPSRSLIKYWPLFHAMQTGTHQFPSIAFVEVSKPDSTFGVGFEDLAQFVARRFIDLCPRHFRFGFVDLQGADAASVARDALAFLGQGVGWLA